VGVVQVAMARESLHFQDSFDQGNDRSLGLGCSAIGIRFRALLTWGSSVSGDMIVGIEPIQVFRDSDTGVRCKGLPILGDLTT
jgi:hypothetical protein